MAILSLVLAVIALSPMPARIATRVRLPRDLGERELALAFVVALFALAAGLAPYAAALLATLTLVGLGEVRRARSAARARRVRAALPGVAEALAAAVRAGLPLPEAFVAASAGQDETVAGALRETAALLRLGRAHETAMQALDGVFGPEALLLRETLRAFHRRGGNVARALDRAAALARAETELREEIDALTAQGRTSALVLALLAPCGLLFYAAADPLGARAFLADPRGQLLLSVALALEGVGAFWLWRLVRR